MGEAKRRGKLADRVATAQARQQDESPINIPCKTCKAVLNGFQLVKTSAAGAAWQKKCDCGAVTTALVQSKHSSLQRTFKSSLSMAREITGDDKRVSVSFLEKDMRTVETGVVLLP